MSIPATVQAIDPAFFQQFPGATSISVAADNPTYQSHNGMLFGANEAAEATSLLLVPEGLEGAAVLPLTLATVPACVLTRCHKLSAVVFPNGGTGSSSLATRNGILYTADLSTLLAAPAGIGSSVTLAAETQQIAEGAFWGNTALDTLVVNGNVEGIIVNPGFDPADPDATDDKDIPAFDPAVIANATVALTGDFNKGAWEAAGFTHFSEPAQPGATIEPVEGSGFAFTLLDDYTLTVRWAGDDAAPAALRIPAYGMIDGVQYTVSTIAEGGFAGQSGIVTVDMPETITQVEAGAFEGCTSLQTVNLANAVQRIGARAFADTSLLSVVLPTDLETIGAEAFAGLSGTVVVALHDVALVSDAAFEGSVGLSVYVPVCEDGAYAISAGLPASGNHIYPYGVKVGAQSVTLEEGESANLFEDGYLEAPTGVEVDYAYKARPVSVDTETGDVEAKQVGSSDVQVSLSVSVPTVYVKSIVASEARLKKAALSDEPENGGLGEVLEVAQTISLASAAMSVFTTRAAATPAAETPEYGFTYTASDPSIITIATDSQAAVNKELNRRNWTFGSSGRSSLQNTFIGDIKWTGGTAASPTAGSVVTVNVASGGMKLHPEFMTTEVYRHWLTQQYTASLANGYADDAEGPLRKLVGFRFPTTNSYVTVEQLTSGEAFTFSFIIPDEGLGSSENGTPDYITGPSAPAADGYVGISMHFTPGIVECVFEDTGKVISGDWRDPESTSNPLMIEGSAAVVFSTNGGLYENTKMDAMGLPDTTSAPASVWSDIGGEVQLPSTGRLYRDNYVFVGWYDTAASTGGNPIPDTMTSDMAGKSYYARWQAATNTFDYSMCGTGIMCISSDFIIDSMNYPKSGQNWLFGSHSVAGAFRGKISWTGGTDRGPTAGSIITVDMPRGGYDLHPWFATEEIYRMWFSEGDGAGWGINTSVQGGDAVKKLLGFRFPSTGSYVSLETAVSGEPYTFSFVLPASGFSSSEAGTRTDYVRSPNPTDADYALNSTDVGRTGLRINYTKGIIDAVYEDTGTILSGDTHDGTAEVEGSAAVYFYPNGGQYRYAYYSEEEGGRQSKAGYAAAVWSTIGGRIYTPESVLDAPAGKVFAGWYDTSDATGGERLPDTLTSAEAGKRYYARWATATNTWDYSAVSNGVIRIASRYLIENYNYPNAGKNWMFATTAEEVVDGTAITDAFKGTITWTGGTVDGPGPGSTVTVNVPAAGYQLHQWFMTDEIWKRWFNNPLAGNLSNGGNPLTELKGFWFPSTGSYVTLEKATSGEAYNFTFIIPDSGYGAPATGTSYDGISAPGANGFGTQSGIHLFNTNVMECDYETVGTVVRGDLNDPASNTNPLVIDGAAAVYFHPNGGKFTNENMARAGLFSESADPAATFSTIGEKMQLPTHRVYRDGMVFLGWYDTAAATGGNEISDTMESSMAGKTYYARWMNPAVDTYEVRYDANGGTGTIARDYMNMAAASTLSNGAGFKRVGYEVTAWTTNADGTGVKFTTGQTGILPSSFTDRTVVRGSIVQLYAQWTPIEYYVVLATPGQTTVEGLPADAPLVAFEATATAAASYTLPSPRLRGHNFDSWYTTYDNEENTWGGNKLSAGDAIDIREYVPDSGSFVEANEGLLIGRTLILYAGWTEKNYTVHFRNDLYSHTRPFVQDKDVQVVQNIGYNEGTVNMLGADVADLRYDGRYYTAWGTRKYNSTLADAEANKTAAADTTTSLSIKEIVDGMGSAEYMDDPWNSTDIYLYPQWEFIEFSITFAHNYATDGDGAPKDSVTLPVNKTKITLRDDGFDDGLYLDGVLQEGNLQLGRDIYSGYGYEHLGWNTADGDLSKNVFEVGIAAGGVGVMAFRQMFEVEYDPNDPALSTTTRGITLVPQWNEYSYDIVLRNGAVTSGGTPLVTGIKYHESVELPRDTFTKPGYSLIAWAYGSEEGENKYAPKNPLNEATLVSAIVNQNAVTGNNATLPLYAVWNWRTDIPYYVYAYYEAADGTYATGDGVMMHVGYGSLGDALTLDDEYKEPVLDGYEYDEGITEARNDGAEVKEDGSGCLRVYFKKQYTVEFRTGTGGAYTADDGVVTSVVTYDHGSGASVSEVGTPATVADAAAALDEVNGFFVPAAGNYFAKWLPTSEYTATTDRDQNAAAADLPNEDVTENLSFTSVFKTIAYKLAYKHAYIAGMPDAPDDSTLAATEFAYADLASAATQPNVGSSTAIVSPVGFTHTGWQLEDGSQQFGLTDKVTLDGDANSTFARLGLTAVPAANAADPSTQEVTLCATWNERTYSIDFWKYNSIRPRDMCTVNADDGYYTDLSVNDKIKLPSQDTTGATKPSVSDSIFSYNIASWNVLDDADGTKKATFLPGHEYTVLELLGGENALELPDENEGVLNLYAGWKVVYSADLPDSKDALAHIRMDLTATESMSDDTVRIVSRTPRTLLVGAESEVTNQTVVLDLFKDETGADLSGMTDIDSGVAFSYNNKSFGINGGSLATSDRLLIGPAADESDLTQFIEDHLKLSYDGSRFSMNMRYAGEEHAWGQIAKIKWIVSLKESQYENTEYLFTSNGDVADTNAAEGRQD